MRMNKMIFSLFAIGTIFFSACNRPISTTDEWVSFCKSNPDAKSIYNMYESMTLSNCLEIFGELEAELEDVNNCTKEKCYAFTYILHLLSFDWDTHPERFGDNERDRLNEVFHRHYFFAALYNASKQTGSTQTGAISTEIQTLARLFGSKMMQESTMSDEDVINTITGTLSSEEVLGILGNITLKDIAGVWEMPSAWVLNESGEKVYIEDVPLHIIFYENGTCVWQPTDDSDTATKTKYRLFDNGRLVDEKGNEQRIVEFSGNKMKLETIRNGEVTCFMVLKKISDSKPYFEDNVDELQPLNGYEEINDEPTGEDVILPYSTDEIAPEY